MVLGPVRKLEKVSKDWLPLTMGSGSGSDGVGMGIDSTCCDTSTSTVGSEKEENIFILYDNSTFKSHFQILLNAK